MRDAERSEVLVIGAGQTGLAAGYHLARRGIDYRILEADERIGDVWRRRYDSLTLYSPARYDSLPGMRFPLPGHAYPTGRQMADYLEAYAARFRLRVETGIRVDAARAPAEMGEPWTVTAGERRFEAGRVIVATGAFARPRVPAFASQLDASIRQLHSSEYRNPGQLADGPVLVVGLSHSGSDLAHEIAATHPVIVSGKAHGQLPFSVDGLRGRIGWLLAKRIHWHLLTLDTPIGRKMAPHVRQGGAPLLRWRMPDLAARGVELVEAKTVGVQDGKPVLADGRVVEVTNVLWCTGFEPDHDWISPPIEVEDGWPVQDRGIAAVPGLYFLGLLFQYSFTSMLVLGAGRDAEHVVRQIAAAIDADRAATARAPVHASTPGRI